MYHVFVLRLLLSLCGHYWELFFLLSFFNLSRGYFHSLVLLQRKGEIKLWEAECLKIDSTNKKVFCRSTIDNNLVGSGEFSLDYDYLVIAIGAQVNTFNTPGVMENCHFLKVYSCFLYNI